MKFSIVTFILFSFSLSIYAQGNSTVDPKVQAYLEARRKKKAKYEEMLKKRNQAAQPKPVAVQPTPAPVQPTPVPVQPTPAVVKPVQPTKPQQAQVPTQQTQPEEREYVEIKVPPTQNTAAITPEEQTAADRAAAAEAAKQADYDRQKAAFMQRIQNKARERAEAQRQQQAQQAQASAAPRTLTPEQRNIIAMQSIAKQIIDRKITNKQNELISLKRQRIVFERIQISKAIIPSKPNQYGDYRSYTKTKKSPRRSIASRSYKKRKSYRRKNTPEEKAWLDARDRRRAAAKRNKMRKYKKSHKGVYRKSASEN